MSVKCFRGTSNFAAKPFTVLYGNLKEIRSLLSDKARFIVLTATATSTKRKIFELIDLDPVNTFLLFERTH